jgi:hypothetical protein
VKRKPLDVGDMPLNRVLGVLGFTHKSSQQPNGLHKHDVLDADDRVVFTGNAGDVWAWLRETKRIK